MASKKPRSVPYRRKREAKTDYHKRIKLLASRKPRVAIRFTNQKIIGQIIEFSPIGDLVKVAVSSDLLKKQHWTASGKNVPAAYLTGLLLAKKAAAAGITKAILDTGFKQPELKGKIYAFLKGALDGGLDIPHSDESIFPKQDKIEGQHLKNNLREMFMAVKERISGKEINN